MAHSPGTQPRRASLRDVAAIAGVSVSVVSRVLNNDPSLYLRDEKRERVIAAAEELNYRPNAAGRALRRQSSEAIGVMLPRLTNPFYYDIIRGVEDQCDRLHILPMFGRSERLTVDDGILVRMVGEGRVDGFVLQLTDNLTEETIDQIVNPTVPRVLIQAPSRDQPGSVQLDDPAGIRVATEHLISLGHEDIGFSAGPAHHDSAQACETAFRTTMQKAGLQVNSAWTTHTGLYFENGQAAFDSIWSMASRPTAIVVSNVNLALGIIRAAVRADVAIPDDLSIVGLYDSALADQSFPRLTVVDLPLLELGRTAVNHLHDILKGEEPQVITITDPPPRLISRSSTRPPRSD